MSLVNFTFFYHLAVKMELDKLRIWLDREVEEYNSPRFILNDPICVPHSFTLKQDIEISAFFAAILAWGNRTSIIRSAQRIMDAMHRAPYDFVCTHEEKELKAFLAIKHRTFNATDLLYFIHYLKFHYTNHSSLEDAFLPKSDDESNCTMKERLIYFYEQFFMHEHPHRTEKHISTPAKKSACKRLNMFLRWMVRQDDKGVDFGLWQRIPMSDLICPLDVHVGRVAHRLGLIRENKSNWLTAEELTMNLRELDPQDPVKYDYALFGLGAEERMR